MYNRKLFMAVVVACAMGKAGAQQGGQRVELVKDGKARVTIYAPERVMAADITVNPNQFTPYQTEMERRRLRESVRDLARCLNVMSGATVEVNTAAPAAGIALTPVLIGEVAKARWGEPKRTSPYKQGWRMVVSPAAIGLWGQSDEASSYAIYEVLHRLGCRWYLPSALGEVIPKNTTVTLPVADVSHVPPTISRNIWYSDDDYRRRNRLGGMNLEAGHALEMYVTADQRKANPEWKAVIGGKPHDHRLKWSHPGVQQAVAEAVLKSVEASGRPTASISPDDGATFDESDDKKWDEGDFDPTLNGPSITDRMVKFGNAVAEIVTQRKPDLLLGFLAYVQYTRAPVKAKLHPNLVPEIAPITYCRAHAMTDGALCPSRAALKPIVEGWGKASPKVAYYNYMFHLAEVGVPYPMIHQMKQELPIIYRSNVVFWQPETMANFESVLPGMYLTIRKSWNPAEDSDAILNELYRNFYGAAEVPMKRYWTAWDEAWTKSDEHSGSLFGYVRRFPPQFMKQVRGIMNEALAKAATPEEKQRVKLQDDSLRQFERFMQMRWDLNAGQLNGLEAAGEEFYRAQVDLGNQWAPQYAFSKAGWTPHTITGLYYKAFMEATNKDATRIEKNFNVVKPALAQWKYAVDKDDKGVANGWHNTDFKDAGWKTTDVGVETWATLGLMNYMGTLWYRQVVNAPAIPAGKKTMLWVGSTDGKVQIWVNGQPVSSVDEKGEAVAVPTGYCQPFSFDITGAVKPGAANVIAIKATRTDINELGTGGLLSPAYIYHEK